MEQHKDIKLLASNAGLSGLTALTGLGIEAASHNPLFLLGGGLMAYACWKFELGEKLIDFRNRLVEQAPDGEQALQQIERKLAKSVAQTETPATQIALPIEFDGVDGALQLGTVEQTGQRFDPAMDDVLGKGMLLAGSQGTGKSNIIGLVAQSAGAIGQMGMPLLIIDFKGEFFTICDVVPNGIVVGHPDAADQFPGRYFGLTRENAAELATLLMESPLQVVLDIPSYNGDNDEVAAVISLLLHGLMDWSRGMKRQGLEPWPCLVITDEAHNFLPESQKLSALVMQNPKESFGMMTAAYSRMANTGRSFGYTLLMATQRLPNIAKWSIANLQCKVILAHAEKNDLNACETETGGMVDREEIKRLKQGTGIVIGFTKDPVVVHFDKQQARHVSVTPKTNRLQEQFKDAAKPRLSRALAAHTEVKPVAPSMADLPVQQKSVSGKLTLEMILDLADSGRIDTETMLKMMERLPVVDADDERYTDPEIEVQANITLLQDRRKMAVGQTHIEPAYSPEIQQALDAYDRGANTLDKLAVALNKSSWQTRAIYAQVRDIRGVK